ncbi:DUF4097 family beta strand repeat-containing protein [Sphingobacterium wenxiniae]|uniref:Adhesin n=1 Tax=Sphingobacterium wenxiniae TaxID=683125 RepID=A0A1I6TUY4_9SPHI|nr:hypothetical protein [Sphingobacterium wenxiniae]SFS92797.1 hypothetical protein SAMN05660206_10751 [Sphingobacterium wenxiniae]
MKTSLLTASLILWVSFLVAQQKEVTYVEKDFTASTVQKLEASTSGGSIKVEGGNNSKATVAVILSPNGNSRTKGGDLQTLFEKEYDLELEVKNGVLVAKAKRKNNRGNNPLSVSLRISVPKKIASDINTAGGSITLNNLEGNQNFQTAGGSLTLSQLAGNIKGQTAGGSIRLADSQGDIGVTTAGGSIRLDNIRGTISANTSGGSITAKDVSGTLTASTSGGSISLDACEGNIQAGTSGGSINASVTKVTKSLQLSTSGGSVRIAVPKGAYDVDLHGSRVDLAGGDFNGTKTKKSIQGKLNGGGSSITASSSSGSVALSWL